MKTLEQAYNIILKEAVVRKKLDNFSQILNSNPDLKIALELCVLIEKMEPNAEALVVGGSVRDILLGKKPKDIDIATNAPPETIQALFPHTVPVGIAFLIVECIPETREIRYICRNLQNIPVLAVISPGIHIAVKFKDITFHTVLKHFIFFIHV